MRCLGGLIFFALASTDVFTGHHELNLKAKQPRTELWSIACAADNWQISDSRSAGPQIFLRLACMLH